MYTKGDIEKDGTGRVVIDILDPDGDRIVGLSEYEVVAGVEEILNERADSLLSHLNRG